MAKKPNSRQQARSPAKTLQYAPKPRSSPPGSLAFAAGTACLALSAAMSLLLVIGHISGHNLPGCGAGGACDQLARSAWGKVPVLNWPVSFVGAAYFLAALTAWIVARGALPAALRYVARLGALASLGFCALILIKWMFCPYCLAAHLGNFAFWILVERTRPRAPRTGFALASSGAVFLLATITLAVWNGQQQARARQKAERDRAASAQRIIAGAQQPGPSTSKTTTATGTMTQPSASANTTPQSTTAETRPPFTGRYRRGPEVAAIRIVLFTDYQCPDCLRIETDVEAVFKERTDVSVSIKHFPFCKACNPRTPDMHPNACWAARAAEAAGILWGNDGFWKMHDWLFAHRGLFETSQELEAGIREIGHDPQGFAQVMQGAETLKRVQRDIAEAVDLGLFFTPMIFINGVELKGWNAPDAVRRTVTQVAAANPPPRTADDDHPPRAFEKYIADWREQPRLTLPADRQAWSLGPEDASLQVVMWGDYQEPNTVQADALIRAFMAGRSDVQYAYRHYPFNSDCNPTVKERRHPLACRMAQAAEAAGRLTGNEGYWKMHVWLMEHRDQFSDDTLRAAASGMGLDASALFTTMQQPEVQGSISDDIQAGRQLPTLRIGMAPGVSSIPTIFVDGRYVPRWQLNDRPILDRILDEAAKK